MSCNANNVWTRKAVLNLMVWSWLALLSQASAWALQSVELVWLPSTNANVAGYKIYAGTESRNYTSVFLVGNVTNTIITGLVEGTTNYFAAKAFDTATNESAFSEETTYVVPASVTPPVVTNDPPVIINTPPVVTNDPPVITNTPPVITNTPPVITNTPPVITNTPPVITNTPPVITNTPPVVTNTPPPVVTNTPVVVNAPPTLNALPNISLVQNTASVTVNLSGISSGSKNEKQTLVVTATSGNTALISKVTVNYTSPKSTGTLTFKPVANAVGTAIITVKVNDGGATNNFVTQTINVVVTPPPPVKLSASALAALPKFSRQLTNSATLAGKNVSLSVAVAGRAPFKYQWKCNGTNIVGAISATLSLKNVKAAQSGIYSVLVLNSVGVTNSIPAALMVYDTPAAALTSTLQSNGSFSFNVTGIPGYKYVVQASSDMSKWSSVTTNTSPFTFVDTNCLSFDQHFYRSYYLP